MELGARVSGAADEIARVADLSGVERPLKGEIRRLEFVLFG
jgi:hypothetical protein